MQGVDTKAVAFLANFAAKRLCVGDLRAINGKM